MPEASKSHSEKGSALRRVLAGVSASPLRGPLRALSSRGMLPSALWRRLPGRGSSRFRRTRSCSTPSDDKDARHLFWVGVKGQEPETTGLFEREVANAETVVDVGANRGLFTLTALAANPKVRLVSIEANPGTADYLRSMIELNGWTDRVDLRNVAAGDQPCTMEFHVPDLALASSARLVAASHRSAITGAVIEIEMVRVDDVVESAQVVKIDVEGAEHLVLAGMTRLLATSKPVVFIEVLPEARNDLCQEILADAGYRFFHLVPSGEVERPGLIPDPARRDRNYVCRPG